MISLRPYLEVLETEDGARLIVCIADTDDAAEELGRLLNAGNVIAAELARRLEVMRARTLSVEGRAREAGAAARALSAAIHAFNVEITTAHAQRGTA